MLSYFYANGNILIGTSRCLPFRNLTYQKKAYNILKRHAIDCLFVIGGDGSYRGALSLKKFGMHVICLPGTIDNDIASTERTIGFSTALNGIVTNIDSIRNSFDSHLGICFVEVMGRRFPDLAITAGIATQAEAIITIENILTIDQIINIANQT
jgi:6-phosphofructokinase 1